MVLIRKMESGDAAEDLKMRRELAILGQVMLIHGLRVVSRLRKTVIEKYLAAMVLMVTIALCYSS